MSNTCYVIIRREVNSTNIYTGCEYEYAPEDTAPVLVCGSFDIAVEAKGKMIKETYYEEYAKKGPRTDVFLTGDGTVEIHTEEDGSSVEFPLESITYIDFIVKEVPMNM